MSEKTEVIDWWTRELNVDAEQQLHAVELLNQSIEENAESLREVKKWFGAVTTKRRTMSRVLIWSCLVISLLTTIASLIAGKKSQEISRIFSSVDTPQSAIQIKTKNHEEALLLYGDMPNSGRTTQKKALWESDLKNPAFYAEYVLNYLNEHKSLPSDFLEVAYEIDPDNAWFTYLAAAVKSKDLCKKGAVHPRSPVTLEDVNKASANERDLMRRRVVYHYEIVDEAKAAEVIALWRSSLKQPKYDSYQLDMHRLRYPILSRRESYQDFLRSVVYQTAQPSNVHELSFFKLLCCVLERSDLKSEEGKLFLSDVEKHFTRSVAKQPDSMMDALVMLSGVRMLYQMAQVKSMEGLNERIIESWNERRKRMDIHFSAIDKKRTEKLSTEALKKHGSLITSLSTSSISKFTLNPPPYDNKDLAPARLVENAAFLRVFIAFFGLLFAGLTCFGYIGNKRKMHIRLSQEACLAMPVRVHVMISFFAVLPLLYFTLLYVFTPLAGKDYSVTYLPLGFVPISSAILWMISLPRLMIHRFTAPIELLSIPSSSWHMRMGWGCALVALLPMHVLPWLVEQKWLDRPDFLSICLLMPLVLWLLWNLVRVFFKGSMYDRVMHGMRRQLMMTASMASIFALAILWGSLLAWEKHWLQKDELMKVPADVVAVSAYEGEVIKSIHKEMMALMGYDKTPAP